jgi:DNA invertase Pin-like site-specific DNA recombinase
LVSIEEKIDTLSAAGELVFHVFGAIAHFERRLIAECTPDDLDAAAANGRRPGRKALDPEKLEAAFALIAAGPSPTKAVGIVRSTLYEALAQRTTWSAGASKFTVLRLGRLLTVNFRTDAAGGPSRTPVA